MSILQAIILGIVQGLTEFIPVSSSGHLVILHNLMGITEQSLAFDVALHLGTLMALLIFFYKDIILLLKSLIKKDDYTNLAWILALATVPAVIAGLLLEDAAESTFRSSALVSITLIIGALFMIGAEKYSSSIKNKTEIKKIKPMQGLAVGLAQAVALIPGISRSGSTITVGLFAGIQRESATRFAFLLGIPIMVGAVLKVFTSDGAITQAQNESIIFAVGILTAFVSGLFAIKFMLRYLAGHSLNIFAYYRIALGLIVLLSVLL